MENRRLRLRSDKWKGGYQAQKRVLKGESVSRHPYPLELMWLGVVVHLCYNVSLRASSKVLEAVGQLYGIEIGQVSASTIRNWCLKVGFHFLQQELKPGKYVLIADESVGTGRERLLLLLLVPIEHASPISPLDIKEVYVWSVQSKASWSGQAIGAIIEEKTRHSGICIEYAISDAGNNLRKGFAHSQVKWIGDCTHAVANCTQKLLQKEETFQGFIQQMLATRSKWVMSQYHLYLPPALRAKSRFHQLLVVHTWADKMLAHWQQMPVAVQLELAYVWQNQELIGIMADLHTLIEKFTRLFKASGINAHTRRIWQQTCQHWSEQKRENQQTISPKIQQFIQTMNQYLEQQRSVLPQHDQILCCSDVIESIFGKYKNKGGCPFITEDILNIAAYPKHIAKAEVKQALIDTWYKDIQLWKKDFTMPSTLVLKKQLFAKVAA